MPRAPIGVLYIIANLEYGGGHRTCEILAQALPRDEFALHVACDRSNPFWDTIGRLGVCRHEVDFSRRFNPASVLALRRIIRQEHVRLVHSMGRRVDFLALLAARWSRIPIISHVAIRTASFDVGGLRKRLYRLVEAWMERRFDLQIAVSRAVEQELQGAGVPSRRIVYIPEAVEVDRLLARQLPRHEACQRLGLDPHWYWVGTIGRLVPMKGQRVFIDAMAHLQDDSDARGLVVGSGPLADELKALAEQFQLGERVRFLPFLDDQAVFYSAIDLFVFPSVFSEAFPRVLLEAMVFGRPIIASDLPASREVLEDVPFARYVPPGDAQRLAETVLRMRQGAEQAQRLAAQAPQWVRARYDLHRLVPRVADAYRAVRGSTPC